VALGDDALDRRRVPHGRRRLARRHPAGVAARAVELVEGAGQVGEEARQVVLNLRLARRVGARGGRVAPQPGDVGVEHAFELAEHRVRHGAQRPAPRGLAVARRRLGRAVHERALGGRVGGTAARRARAGPGASPPGPCPSRPPVCIDSTGAAGSHRKNVEPTPTSLRTVMSPPMRRARRRLMARPSPAPPCARVSDMSACTNASKIGCSRSLGMPIPVSSTRT
jgi:hypothetical protein